MVPTRYNEPPEHDVVPAVEKHLKVTLDVPHAPFPFIYPQYPPGPPSAVKHDQLEPVFFASPLQVPVKHANVPLPETVPHLSAEHCCF